MKALDFGGETFQEIPMMFPKLSQLQIEAGKFGGPQVNAMLNSEKLESAMIKAKTWVKSVRSIVRDFIRTLQRWKEDIKDDGIMIGDYIWSLVSL